MIRTKRRRDKDVASPLIGRGAYSMQASATWFKIAQRGYMDLY